MLGRSSDDKAFRALTVYSEVLDTVHNDYVDEPNVHASHQRFLRLFFFFFFSFNRLASHTSRSKRKSIRFTTRFHTRRARLADRAPTFISTPRAITSAISSLTRRPAMESTVSAESPLSQAEKIDCPPGSVTPYPCRTMEYRRNRIPGRDRTRPCRRRRPRRPPTGSSRLATSAHFMRAGFHHHPSPRCSSPSTPRDITIRLSPLTLGSSSWLRSPMR